MIIFIDLKDDVLASIGINKLSEFFSEAARASLLGFHRIVISRPLAKWCCSSLDITEKHKRHIERLGQEYTQLGGQLSLAKFKIVIRDELGGVHYDGAGCWFIGIDEILNGNYLNSTGLILENAQNDGSFYDFILRLSAKNISFGDLSFDLCHGGGSGTGQELRRISSGKKVIACICDTDLLTPGGAKSATYNSVMSQYTASYPVGIAVGTPGREVENFLPLHVIRNITEDTATADRLESLVELQGDSVPPGDCLWLYFDIKNGLPAGKLQSYCSSPSSRSWISAKFNVLESEICNIVIPPLGANVLSSFMNSEALKGTMHKHVRSKYWATHFMEWIENILWVIAGRKRERAN